MPTIGVAKTLLRQCCTVTETEVKDQLSQSGRVMVDLCNAHGTIVGCAVKRNPQARQPVYVSIGQKVSLNSACDIVLKCCLYRIPEPIRQADILARQLARSAPS
ncbi:hypothetical protein ABBQ38_011077 [Trebouxia sp. C0009 RCD-2024]